MKVFAAIIVFLKAVVIALTVMSLGSSIYFIVTDKAVAGLIFWMMIILNGVLYIILVNIGSSIKSHE